MRSLVRLTLISIPAVFAVFLASCSAASSNGHLQRSGMYYDTVVTIDLYGKDNGVLSAAMDECMNMCGRYEKLFNKNDTESDIASINSKKTGVKVDHDTALMINESLKYCELSDGMFDISVKPLTDLWDFHSQKGNIPDPHSLKQALPAVDFRQIFVDEKNDIVTVGENTAIDPGGSAKGYIADALAAYLSGCDITGAIINIGGDIQTVGSKPDNEPFVIGVRDPFNKEDVLIPLKLNGQAVATSGIYERSFTAAGKRYHHILDPESGYPAETDVESATVITSRALDADCLGTICILEGSNSALCLIDNTKDTEAVLILTDGSVVMSRNAAGYIRQ